MNLIYKSYLFAINESKSLIVYRGSTLKTGGSNVGKTLGNGIYVTSNRDDTSKGLAAIDYAGGKFTKGKQGIITTYELKITDNFIIHNTEYYLEDLLKNKKLTRIIKDKIQTWINKGYFKEGLDGKSLLLYIENPPPYLGKKLDISKSGFDGFVQFNNDGTVYEAVVFNPTVLRKIDEIEVNL